MPRKPVAKSPRKGMTVSRYIGREQQLAPYIQKTQLPKLPFEVEPGEGRMALDDSMAGSPFPFQGYLGNYSIYFPGYPALSLQAQRTEYRQATETHSQDMTREWIEFTSKSKSDKSERIQELEKRFTDLSIQHVSQKALRHDGYFGVGHIFIDIKGHENADMPLILDKRSMKKGTLRGFVNIEPMWVTPISWNSYDATLPSFYKPDKWVALNKTCDKTRLLQIISNEVPDIIKPAYNFGGMSLSQLIQPYVERWLTTVTGVNRLINNFSLIALKTNMSGILEGGEDSNIRRRMALARQYGDNMGMFVLDKDEEDLMQITTSLAGLSELQAQAQEHMAMPTHLPLVVLTGITPNGLNASSEGEIEVYHDWNRSQQNAVLRAPLKHMMHIVMLDLWGEIDEEIDFEFEPLKQITGKAAAEIKKTEADAAAAYCTMGALDPMEVRKKLAKDVDSGYNNIDVNKQPQPLDTGEESGEGNGED